MDDEMRRQWEGTTKDEEEITVKRNDGGKLVERVQQSPELVFAQTHMRKKEVGQGRENKIAGWSTKMLEETANGQECEETKEMVQWRSISQEGIGGISKELRGRTKSWRKSWRSTRSTRHTRVLIRSAVSR